MPNEMMWLGAIESRMYEGTVKEPSLYGAVQEKPLSIIVVESWVLVSENEDPEIVTKPE